MAALLSKCTMIEQRGVEVIQVGSPPTSTLQPGPRPERFTLVWPFKTSSFGRTLFWRWCGWKSSSRVVPTATKRILRRRFPGTCETVGQVFKFVWRLYWKINVVCVSLSPFYSFQSQFVTYLLNRPRITCTGVWISKPTEMFWYVTVLNTLGSNHFAWRQGAQRSPLIHTAVGRGPRFSNLMYCS